ncbi:MAG: hypothetical protein JWM49_2033 [Microbacteriaceae bacterium]|nr:hypothetical protein [Microbacteriaceae bacterium]
MKSTEINSARAETETTKISWPRRHRTAVIASCAALVIVAGIGAGAAAFSGHTTGSKVVASKPAASATPSATPKASAPAELPIGSPATTDTKLPSDEVKYQMNDGSFVVVAKNQPLPATVVNDLTANGENTKMSNDGREIPTPGTQLRVTEAIQATGHQACVIVHAIPDAGGLHWKGYAYFTVSSPYFTTADAAQAWCVTNLGVPATEFTTVVLNY